MLTQSARVAKELGAISVAFRQLAKEFAQLAPLLAAVPRLEQPTSPKTRRRAPRLTAARRAALKLQGQYMGTLRGLTPAQKAKVKKIRAQKGLRPALAAARRLSA